MEVTKYKNILIAIDMKLFKTISVVDLNQVKLAHFEVDSQEN